MKNVLMITIILLIFGSGIVLAQKESKNTGVFDSSGCIKIIKEKKYVMPDKVCIKTGIPTLILEDGMRKIYLIVTEKNIKKPSDKLGTKTVF